MNCRHLPIRVLTTKAAVLEHDVADIDVVPESEAAEGESPLAFPEGDSLQFLDMMGSAPVVRVSREDVDGSLEERMELRMASAKRSCQAFEVGAWCEWKRAAS